MTEPATRIDTGVTPVAAAAHPADVFAAPQPSERGPSPLELLRSTLAKPVERELLRLRVPMREGIVVAFDTSFDNEQRKAWQKRATKKSRRPGRDDEVDEMLYASIVIANCCRAIEIGGVEAHDTNGPLTFASPAVWEMVKATEPLDAIKAFYGNDAHVLNTGGEIMLGAGFDDDLEAEEAGPTTG